MDGASSADPGSLVAIGTASEPARYLGYTSEPALPATTVRILTNSGVLPRRKLARGEAIVVTSTGGKTGPGQVRITAVLATAPETALGAVSGHPERVTTAPHAALAPSDTRDVPSAPLPPAGGYVASYLDLDFEPTAMSRSGDIAGVRRDDKLNKVMDGIHDAGEITGVSASQPFLWSAAAGLRRLGLLTGATAGLGTAINNHGRIVGAMAGPLWPWRVGFIWDSAQGYRRIGTDTEFCEPLFINDDGVVIGKYRRLLGPDAGGHPTYDTRIFRWTEARGLELLDDLEAPPIAYVVGLSETGEILARLWDRRWARLVPVTVSPPSRL